MSFGKRTGFKKRAPAPKQSWIERNYKPTTQDRQRIAADMMAQQAAQWVNEVRGGGGMQPSFGGGSSGGGGGGGYGGGGGGGFVDYYARYEPYRAELRAQLDGLKAAVPGYLDQYRNTYQDALNRFYGQNQALQGTYQADIRRLLADLQGGANASHAALQGDLQAQGADTRALAAQAAVNAQGANAMASQGELYNMRLNQVMANDQINRQSAGALVDQSARAQMENEYMRQLAAIGMLGM